MTEMLGGTGKCLPVHHAWKDTTRLLLPLAIGRIGRNPRQASELPQVRNVMRATSGLVIAAGIALTGAACSHSRDPAAPTATAAPDGCKAPKNTSAWMCANGRAVFPIPLPMGPTLYQVVHREQTGARFTAMDHVAQLPAWARTGGTEYSVTVDALVEHAQRWLLRACEFGDCRTGELYLLLDPGTEQMWGLFVGPTSDSTTSRRDLIWLGAPNSAIRKFLANQPRYPKLAPPCMAPANGKNLEHVRCDWPGYGRMRH